MARKGLPAGVACRLILVRHAAAEGDGRFQGQLDVPLTDGGRGQLCCLVEKLSRYPIQDIYTSDLKRARETAAAVGKKRRLSVKSRAEFREMGFGEWQGRSWEEIEKRFPQLASEWMNRFPRLQIPGAERFAHFRKRVEGAFQRIVAGHRRQCVLVVTHAGVIRTFLAEALSMKERDMFRLPQDPGGVNVVDYLNGDWIVRCVNA